MHSVAGHIAKVSGLLQDKKAFRLLSADGGGVVCRGQQCSHSAGYRLALEIAANLLIPYPLARVDRFRNWDDVDKVPDFCSKYHRDKSKGVEGLRPYIDLTIKGGTTSADDFTLSNLVQSHPEYLSISSQFLEKWIKPGTPKVQNILRVEVSGRKMRLAWLRRAQLVGFCVFFSLVEIQIRRMLRRSSAVNHVRAPGVFEHFLL